MKHLGPEAVRTQFKGMVDRCNDCGFDLASGRVEVVPTAHYMMGGVEFEPGCTTEIPGLYVAGEDAGGVHGANRLGEMVLQIPPFLAAWQGMRWQRLSRQDSTTGRILMRPRLIIVLRPS